jgi:hypothetical protein
VSALAAKPLCEDHCPVQRGLIENELELLATPALAAASGSPSLPGSAGDIETSGRLYYLVSTFMAFSRPSMVVGNMRSPMRSLITPMDWR